MSNKLTRRRSMSKSQRDIVNKLARELRKSKVPALVVAQAAVAFRIIIGK
jgi:hypothetical protein